MSGAWLRLSWVISASYSKSLDRAQALDDRARRRGAGELDDEDVERLGADVAEVARRLAR